MMRLSLAALLGLLALAWLSATAAFAQADRKSPLGLPMPPAAGSSATTVQAEPPGLLGQVWNRVMAIQQKLNRDMAAAVRDLKAKGSLHAAWVLGFISFMYGVLHAAGPGHGKAVISSYVLANERTVRRGIWLSFLAAIIQALSAIAIVGLLAIALNATSLTIKATESWIETLSWGFVALVGAWMLYGQIRRLPARQRSEPTPSTIPRSAGAAAVPASHGVHHDCCGHGAEGHGHEHAHGHAAPGPHGPEHHVHGPGCGHDHHAHAGPQTQSHAGPQSHAHGHTHTHAAHDHVHTADGACCGHAHMPAPKDLEGELGWSKALAIAGSVGIRPCTGAILVLIFALSQGLLWAGVFATFAMAIGTAITTSVLAALAVGSKQLAIRMAGADSRWGSSIATAAGLMGSTLVLAMGTMFFLASLHGTAPL